MKTTNPQVYRCAWAYVKNGGVSFAQSFLKHSLVPVKALIDHLPKQGTILDLGCGEGILANLVARSLPNCEIVGYDLDQERIAIANKNAPQNARFETRDIFDLPDNFMADGIILNDLVHHLPFHRQRELFSLSLQHLHPGGAIVHKEVDRDDWKDWKMTNFFDSRLYPEDRLCFRPRGDWIALWKRMGVEEFEICHLRHPWPASRTLILARRPGDERLETGQQAAAVGKENRSVTADTVTVFMTGATGFIGHHLALRLLNRGLGDKKVRLIVLIRDRERMLETVARAGAVPLVGDLNDMPYLRAAMQGVDYVFHLAAEVKLTGGADVWRNNHEGTVDLLEAVRDSGITRFIHASTMGAVDRAPNDPCTSPLDEQYPPHPLSDYGRSKLEAENAVKASGVPFSILRIPWGYGPGMTPDTHVRFLVQGVGDRKLFSKINFPGRVSILAVEDLVECLVLLAEKEQAVGETYFASDGMPLSLGNLFRRAANLMGHRAAGISILRPASTMARKLRRFLPLALQNLNSDVLTVSNRKITALGFQPSVSQRQGLNLLLQDLGLLPRDDRSLISVVTGAASGIGRELALQMKEEGHGLLLIDKDRPVLEELARDLDAEGLALDLTDPSTSAALEDHLDRCGYRLDWVVNNAGIGVAGTSAEIAPGIQEKVIDLNCRALTSISRLALRHFQERGHGTLISIASSAGFQPLPFIAAYAASKAYVQSYTRALTFETRKQPGILVLNFSPSGTATNFQAMANVKKNPGEALMPPAKVAQEIIKAAYARKSEVILGRSGKMMNLAARVMPYRLQARLWGRLMAKMRLSSSA